MEIIRQPTAEELRDFIPLAGKPRKAPTVLEKFQKQIVVEQKKANQKSLKNLMGFLISQNVSQKNMT